MFSGSFGVRSIVLCKCSGKYIDIYFKLKITYVPSSQCLSFSLVLKFMNIKNICYDKKKRKKSS